MDYYEVCDGDEACMTAMANENGKKIVLISSIVFGVILIVAFGLWCYCKKKRQERGPTKSGGQITIADPDHAPSTIKAATATSAVVMVPPMSEKEIRKQYATK